MINSQVRKRTKMYCDQFHITYSQFILSIRLRGRRTPDVIDRHADRVMLSILKDYHWLGSVSYTHLTLPTTYV